MKRLHTLLLILLCTSAAFAQPVYSPEVRAKKEMQWMQDSLHITPDQAAKLNDIVLKYNRNMDKANAPANRRMKEKTQKQLMLKKDAEVKGVLKNELLYKQYYRREKEIRRIENIKYKGDRQPL